MTDKATTTSVGGVGNSGFDHKTAYDLLSGKAVNNENLSRFVSEARWACDNVAWLNAHVATLHQDINTSWAEIALLKRALLDVESADTDALLRQALDALDHFDDVDKTEAAIEAIKNFFGETK